MALGAENEQQHKYERLPIQQQQHQHQQRQRTITPLPYTKSSPGARHISLGINACSSSGNGDGINPTSVVRRNARERNRVKQVNNGFTNLRQHIPAAVVADLSNGRRGIGPGADKKLSKVNTLRMAVEYIRRLQLLLDENAGSKVKSSTTSSSNSFYKQNNALQTQKDYYDMNQKNICDSSTASNISMVSSLSTYSSSSSSSNILLSFAPPSSPMNCEQQFHMLQQQQHHHHHHHQHDHQSNLSHQSHPILFNSFKLEHPENVYEGNQNTSCSSSGAEDDEILDYISLWQDDL